MMVVLYRLGLRIFAAGIRLAALAGHEKAKQFIAGRLQWKEKLRGADQHLSVRYWFHCSSLGEFEQGRPVMEALKKRDPSCSIVLSFFSPSGYEIQKKFSGADRVVYLPMDSPANARLFVQLVKPTAVFFIKYEYWYFFLRELHSLQIPVYVVSAIFRPSQRFFRWYGSFFRRMLELVTWFFVQDERSAELLHRNGLNNCEVTGDTRFDRVARIASSATAIPALDKFKGSSRLIVAGSTWEKDEEILLNVFDKLETSDIKLVIAPHEISTSHLANLRKRMQGKFRADEFIFYSASSSGSLTEARVLVIDTIGILSSVYRYASWAYIGGGFGKGIHNILEAAVYGVPVLFGPNYSRFKEAKELIGLGAAFPIRDENTLLTGLRLLVHDQKVSGLAASNARDYVHGKTGATDQLLKHLFAEVN